MLFCSLTPPTMLDTINSLAFRSCYGKFIRFLPFMRNLRDISWKSHKLPVTRAKNPVTLPWAGWLMYQGAGSKFYTGCTHWSHIHTNVTLITTRKYSGRMHTACFGSDFSSGDPTQWSSMSRGPCTEGVGGPVMSDSMSGWGRGCTGMGPMVRSKAWWVIVTWTRHVNRTDRCYWKHYFPSTSLVGGNLNKTIQLV